MPFTSFGNTDRVFSGIGLLRKGKAIQAVRLSNVVSGRRCVSPHNNLGIYIASFHDIFITFVSSKKNKLPDYEEKVA